MLYFALLLWIVQLVNCIEVELPNGKIRGRTTYNIDNLTFYAFQEIPYASPPVGNLRFKPPVPPKKWDNVLDATQNTKICYQEKKINPMENEDCLYLNVYTPVNPNNITRHLDVIVFIHGGKFSVDSAVYNNYGPDFLIAHDIVVVTTNYRLGALGFLSTSDEVISGNYGLKDQNFAIRWVNENIHLFGGDPKRITIAGQSAGAACTSFQILSKKSQGLFRAAIVQSGSAISSWAYQKYARKIAFQVAATIDGNFTEDRSSEELLELLRSAPANEIAKAKIPGLEPEDQLGLGNLYAPVIEPETEEAFITAPMHESFKNGDFNRVPLLIGYNSEEKITLAKNLEKLKKLMTKYDDDLSLIVNPDFNIEGKEKNVLVGEKIRAIYTDGKFQDDLPASIRFHGDVRYTTSVIRHAALQSNFADVYLFQFSYDGTLGNVEHKLNGTDGSVAHSENNKYIWKILEGEYDNSNRGNFGEKDHLTSRRFVKIVTNFVKNLNPTPEPCDLLQNITWPRVCSKDIHFVDIDEDLKIRTHPKKYKEWKHLYNNYGHPPYITY